LQLGVAPSHYESSRAEPNLTHEADRDQLGEAKPVPAANPADPANPVSSASPIDSDERIEV
jgi:hypothetical protein